MDKKIGDKVFQQVMEIWIGPEIERRKKLGKIDENFVLSKAQVVFSLTGGNTMRINDEVKAIIEAKANRDVKKGEPLYERDISSIENIKLTEQDSNSAHITLLYFKNNWIVAFDARYNKEKIGTLIKRSKEYYESAKDDLKGKRLRPFYENCWNSAELSAVCHSLCTGGKNERHGKNIMNFTGWCELGNVDPKYAEVLAQLNRLRALKYSHSMEPENEDHTKFLTSVKEMIVEAEKLIKD